jgi:hypothetical protein
MAKRGITASFVFFPMLSFDIKKMGKMAQVKSEMTLKTLYRYVRAMMTSGLTHFPSWFVFQKYEMGQHWKRVTKKKTIPVQSVMAIVA